MLDHPISVAAASEEVTADEDNTALATSNQNNPEVPQVEEVRKADKDNTASATSNQNNQEVPQVEQHVGISNSYSEPLDLAKYSSSAELEVLGLEKLKIELQSRGLKCGGTLQERAARLFLLKTTPLDKLPKKLLAKTNGRK
nr:unknown [Zea mays]